MTLKCRGLINEKTIYLEVRSVSSSWSPDGSNTEALHSENHSSCLIKMGRTQHKSCCWNVDDVSMHHPLLSFVIFQILSENTRLRGSRTRRSAGFLCKLPCWDRSLGETKVVATAQFSLESSTYFCTNTQRCHPLLTDAANRYCLGLLCRGSQKRICGWQEIILSSKMRIPSVNCMHFSKLSDFKL